MRSTAGAALCVAVSLAAGQAALAQHATSVQEMANSLIGLAQRTSSTASLRDRALDMFLLNDIDGEPGVSQADLVLMAAIERADLRASRIGRVLRDDLNGDFNVSVDELRTTLMPAARKPLRSGSVQLRPTPEQVEEILQAEVARQMAMDQNGDGFISLDEIVLAADREIPAMAAHTRPHRMIPAPEADKDADGTVTEAEFLAHIDGILAFLDSNADGQIAPEERMTAGRLSLFGLPASPVERRLPRSPTRPKGACILPEAMRGTVVAVIGGYDGYGLSDVYMGSEPVATEVFELQIGEVGPPVYVIAGFENDVLMRVSDPGLRLRQVVYTKAQVGLIGATGAALTKGAPACHLQLWRPVSIDNPDPKPFYTAVLKRQPALMVTGYSLGRVNLERASNDTRRRMSDAVAVPPESATAAVWAHFHRFNPGGMILVDPATVKSNAPVSTHLVWPQFAGLAKLVQDGTLVPLPRSGAAHTVREDEAGRIMIGGKVFVPGAGDDMLITNGLTYVEEKENVWVGREQVSFLVTRTFQYPVGLTGAHSVKFVLPSDVPPPTGDAGQSRFVRQDPPEAGKSP